MKNFNFFAFSICFLFLFNETFKTTTPNFDLPSEYTFTLGYKTMTPEENYKEFVKDKTPFETNFHDGQYYVVLQFFKPPTTTQEALMKKHIQLICPVSANTYVVALTKKISKRKLRKYKVRAIVPLETRMKIEKGLIERTQEQARAEINLVVSKSIEKEFIKQELENRKADYQSEFYRETTNMHYISIDSSQINQYAALPWIIGIKKGGL